MSDSGTANEKFELAERLEELAAEIYSLIAQRFSGDEPTRVLFARLAEEELQHAARIGMLKTRYVQNPMAFEQISLDVEAVRGLLAEAKEVKRMVVDGVPLTPQAARQLMLEMEEKFASAHAHSLSATSDPEVRALFELLADQDRQHAALLAGE